MITKHVYNDITWVDVQSPTAEEVATLVTDYKIHDRIAKDILSPTNHPRIDEFDKDLYVVLHFPAHRQSHKHALQEVDFVISKKHLITVRYDTVDSIHWFAKAFEVTTTLGTAEQLTSAVDIFFLIILKMYASISDELTALENQLDTVEDAIFSGQEKEMVPAISKIGRVFLDFKRALINHDEVLSSLQIIGVEQFGRDFKNKIEVIMRDYERVIARVRDNLDALTELRETNNTLVSTRQNDIMKLFTILAFMTFPLSLFIQIISLDGHLFWVALVLVVMCIIGMLTLFKYNRWI